MLFNINRVHGHTHPDAGRPYRRNGTAHRPNERMDGAPEPLSRYPTHRVSDGTSDDAGGAGAGPAAKAVSRSAVSPELEPVRRRNGPEELHDGLTQRPIRPLRHFIDYKQYKRSLLGRHQTSRLPLLSSVILLWDESRMLSATDALSNGSGVSGFGGSKM